MTNNKINYRKIIHPDFKKVAYKLPFNKVMFALADAFLPMLFSLTKKPKSLSHNKYVIQGYGGLPLKVHTFEPNSQEVLPCLLYIHGGGFAYKAAPYHKKLACIYAEKANCRVVFPDYHLLPKYPFPAAYQDVVATYRWIVENAEKLKIDKSHIAVGGDSAGGTLTANLLNNVDGEFCFQMLIYPATGAKTKTESLKEFTDAPLWNTKNNVKLFKMYYANSTQEDILLATPIENHLHALPPTYIETAEFDCLRDGAIEYAELLKKNGTEVILNQTKGTIHGYDNVLSSEITKDSINKRIEGLRKAFEK